MALTSLQGGGRDLSFEDYFKQALNLDIAKLEAIIRGQDHSMPILAAMAAYEVKEPMVTAAAGQQAVQKLQQAQPTVRQGLEQKMDKSGMIPDMAMLNQQRMGPQPPVLPEQAGVGALPAPNMEGMSMAHGGIIAFDDGGDVPGYAGNEESLVEEETSSPIGRFFKNLPFMPQEYSEPAKQKLDAIASERRALGEKLFKLRGPFGSKQQTAQEQAEAERIQARMNELDKQLIDAKMSGSLETKAQERERKVRGTTDPNAGRRYKPYPTDVKKPTAVDPTAGQAVTDANASPGFIPPEKLPASKPPTTFAPTTTRGAAPGAPAAPTTPAARKVGVEDILEAQQAISSQGDAEVRGLLNKYGKDTTAGIEALKKEREVGKPTGEAYSAYEKALQKEETEAKGKEERNLQMALVNAGLGMMAGTSQYALENIGKGAMVGTKQYMDGIDKLETAAKKRQEAMAMIENARRAEARGDWEKKNEFALKAFELDRGVEKAKIDAISSLTGKNKEISAQLLTRAQQDEAARERTLIETQSAERRTKEMAGAQRYAADKYSERQLNPAAAVKEANDTFNDWLRSPKGQMEALKPGAVEAKKRQILIDTFNAMGIPLPPGYASAPARGNLPPLDPRSTPELFIK